nr:LOW QUALITY PROTEIN: SMC5-SMC6 complex localization factor protein 2 [Anser cygnoides]
MDYMTESFRKTEGRRTNGRRDAFRRSANRRLSLRPPSPPREGRLRRGACGGGGRRPRPRCCAGPGPRAMTRPLGLAPPSPSPPAARSRRHFRLAAAGREAARDCRNQSIKEFFKPILKQDLGHKDRSVLCSSDTTYLKDAGNGLPVLSAERFEKKISSAKKVKRKRCQTKHQTRVLC